MKKLLFSIVLLTVSFVTSVAQESKVKEAKSIADAGKDFAQAEKLIGEALQNPETKDEANTWNTAGYIQQLINDKENKSMFLKQPYDTLKLYGSIYKMFDYYFKCDDLAQKPDAKGKIKNKFRKSNAQTLKGNRGNLINGGINFYNENKNEEAYKFFSMYIESAQHPMFEKENFMKTDTLLSQVAYYACLVASRLNDNNKILKYAPIAATDKEYGKYGKEFEASAYKALGDTVKWVASLKDGIEKFPDDQYFFGNLIDYYSNSKKNDEAMKFADDMIAKDPNKPFNSFVKGYLYQNVKDWDNAITAYKKAISLDPKYAQAYSNLGLTYCQRAIDFGEKACTDLNNPQYKKDQETLKGFYQAALPCYEKARELKGDDKSLWLNGLYTIYYKLNMEKQFKEMEALMK